MLNSKRILKIDFDPFNHSSDDFPAFSDFDIVNHYINRGVFALTPRSQRSCVTDSKAVE